MSVGSGVAQPRADSRVGRSDVGAATVLLLVAVFFFRDAILGRGVLFRRDISLVWYPQVESFVRSIAQGAWPLWDPFRGFGQPLLADPSAEVLYPTTWLNLVLPPWDVYTLFVVLHLFFSGLGLYAFARGRATSTAGATLAAASWMASGPFLSLASTWHHMAGAAWLPWCLAGADRAFQEGGLRRRVLLGGAIGAQILAGSADMVAMTLIAVLFLACLERVDWRRPLCLENRGLAWTFALSLAIGVGLSAGQWLPTLEMARGSARFGLDAAERTLWSVHPLVALETFLPWKWADLPLSPAAAQNLLDSREGWLHSLYLGGPLLAVAAAAAFRRRSVGLLGLACCATLVALGRHSPAYALALYCLPPLRILRFPMKAMVVTAFATAALGGIGYDEWALKGRSEGLASRLRLFFPAAALFALSAMASFLLTRGADLWSRALLSSAGGSGSLLLLLSPAAHRLLLATLLSGALVLLALWPGIRGGLRAAAAGALLLLDLGATHASLHPVAPLAMFTHRPEVLKALPLDRKARVYVYDYSTRAKSSQAAPQSLFRLQPTPRGWTPLQFLTMAALDYLTPPVGGRWGLLGSYDLDLLGLQPGPLARLNELLRTLEGTPSHTRLLEIGSVSRLVDLAPPERWPGLELDAVVPGLFQEPIRVYRVPHPLPRVFTVARALRADGDRALELLAGRDFDPRAEVLLPGTSEGGSVQVELPQEAPVGGSQGSGTARILAERPDQVIVRAEMAAPGYLVLVDAFDKGWSARVDGVAAPLLRGNVAFRALALHEGSHEVVLQYRPVSVLIGLSISGVFLVAGAYVLGKTRKGGA